MFKEELKNKFYSLNETEIGCFASIVFIPSGILKSQLLRFGLMEGKSIKCLSKLPGGTIVIKIDHQEIALGSSLAKKIKVIREENLE